MTSEKVPCMVNFLRIKIKYIWRVWGWVGERNLLMTRHFRGETSVVGPQTHAVDPSSILENLHLFPCVYG